MRISDWSSDVCSSDLPYQPTQNRTKRPIACRFHDPASQVTLPSSVVLQKRSAKLLSTMHSVQCVFERINGLEFPLVCFLAPRPSLRRYWQASKRAAVVAAPQQSRWAEPRVGKAGGIQ